jgi:AbrB family looped-hinge helix DNA binding protein
MNLPTVDNKGRILIPADLRERLGLAGGDELEMSIEWDGSKDILVVRKSE